MAGRRAPARPPLPRSRHFLRSRSLAAAIVAGADISSRDLVVDIGAGSGRLTAELASRRSARRRDRARPSARCEPARALAQRSRRRRRRARGRASRRAVPCRREHPVRAHERTAAPAARRPASATRACRPHRRMGRRRQACASRAEQRQRHPVGAFHELRVERKLAAAFDPPPACDAGVLVATRRARPLIPPGELPAYRRFVADAFRRGRRIGGALPRDLDAHQWAERFRRE